MELNGSVHGGHGGYAISSLTEGHIVVARSALQQTARPVVARDVGSSANAGV